MEKRGSAVEKSAVGSLAPEGFTLVWVQKASKAWEEDGNALIVAKWFH
jgi:hypothetical protein